MSETGITGHYHMLAEAKRGRFPDGRTKIGKSLSCFRQWLREPFGKTWNSLQEAREALALPWILFWLVCPMVDKADGRILSDYQKASAHLERLLRDLVFLVDRQPQKQPSLSEYLRSSRTDKEKHP